jgi:hypothetical protein
MLDLERYRGLWVCILDEKVVAWGKNALDVYECARKFGKKPIIFQVPTKEEEVAIL